jgi:hypothetical protein
MSASDIWTTFASELNEQTIENYRRNVDAQAAFVEAWMDAFEEGETESAVEGYGRAYEAWLDAAENGFERLAAMSEGEAVEPEELRDIWLSAANESAKEVMGTTAFAAATGRNVETAMTALREAETANESTLRSMGLATRADVEEVGERLLELERRQQEVERKLDDVLDALE